MTVPNLFWGRQFFIVLTQWITALPLLLTNQPTKMSQSWYHLSLRPLTCIIMGYKTAITFWRNYINVSFCIIPLRINRSPKCRLRCANYWIWQKLSHTTVPYCPFVRGINQWPVDFPQKWIVARKCIKSPSHYMRWSHLLFVSFPSKLIVHTNVVPGERIQDIQKSRWVNFAINWKILNTFWNRIYSML